MLEWDNLVKIGCTKNPYQRITALKRNAEKYGKSQIGRVALSVPHTNYFENERLLHNIFSTYRRGNSELFEINFEVAIDNIPADIEYIDESQKINERNESFLNEMKIFISGKNVEAFQAKNSYKATTDIYEISENSNIDEFIINMYFNELDKESKEELRKNLATLRQRKRSD